MRGIYFTSADSSADVDWCDMCMEGGSMMMMRHSVSDVLCGVANFCFYCEFFRAPRRTMIAWCTPGVEEVRVQQRRKLKRDTHLLEFTNLVCVHFDCPPSSRMASSRVIEHRTCSLAPRRSSVSMVIGLGADLVAPPILVGVSSM